MEKLPGHFAKIWQTVKDNPIISVFLFLCFVVAPFVYDAVTTAMDMRDFYTWLQGKWHVVVEFPESAWFPWSQSALNLLVILAGLFIISKKYDRLEMQRKADKRAEDAAESKRLAAMQESEDRVRSKQDELIAGIKEEFETNRRSREMRADLASMGTQYEGLQKLLTEFREYLERFNSAVEGNDPNLVSHINSFSNDQYRFFDGITRHVALLSGKRVNMSVSDLEISDFSIDQHPNVPVGHRKKFIHLKLASDKALEAALICIAEHLEKYSRLKDQVQHLNDR
ncbi:MAG: hypothetical protein WA921_00140 [Ahrensia sp.]